MTTTHTPADRVPVRSPKSGAGRARRVLARVVRSLVCAALAGLLLAGLPWLLWTAVGNPLHRLPDLLAGDVSNQVVLAALAAVVWLAWAQFAVAFVIELASAVRRTPIPRRIPGVFAAQQGLARALVNGALLMLLPVTVSTLGPAAQVIAMTPAHLPPPPTATALAAVTSTPAPASAPVVQQPATRVLTLTAGGPLTWWDLAEQHLGDGTAWRQLWQLNTGRTQPDGATLHSERTLLRAGWTILVPADTDQPGPTTGSDVGPDGGLEVTVQPGDTLWQIAADHDLPEWQQLWTANTDRAQPDGRQLTDPDVIEPGWTLRIPALPQGAADMPADPGPGRVVIVHPGDTLTRIAAAHDADIDQLIQVNTGRDQPDGQQLTDPDVIEPGWQLLLPDPVGSAADTGTRGSGGVADIPAPTGGAADTVAPPAADIPPPPQPFADSAAEVPPVPAVAEDMELEEGAATAAESGPAVVFAGAGALLAALLAATLATARRRRSRWRSPGQPVPHPPPDLVPMARAVLTAGSAAGPQAQWLDQALHGLAQQRSDSGSLPELVAARLTDDALLLVLAGDPGSPPGAWTTQPGEPGGPVRWLLRRTDPTGYDPTRREYVPAPYPALATVGSSVAGEHWLLDLERLGALRITGDTGRGLELARFLAAELAHNSWAEALRVDLTGFGQEMTRMHPARLEHHSDLAAALTELRTQHEQTTRLVEQCRTGVLAGRLAGGDAWDTQVLLAHPQPEQQRAALDLLEAITAEPARGTAALVLIDPPADPDERDRTATTELDQSPPDASGPETAGGGAAARRGWKVHIDADGVLRVPALGLELIAGQIPADEAAAMAQLLAFTAQASTAHADAADPDTPTDPEPGSAGDAFGPGEPDSVGAEPVAGDRRADPAGRRGSVLPLPDEQYLQQAATTPADLQTLAPAVPPGTRARVEAADTELDHDLAQWRDPGCPRPKVTVLGPVAVHAAGAALSPFATEIVAYLATRPEGVGIEQYATDLWPDDPQVAQSVTVKTKVRASASQVRRLLGVNPHTGQPYLPKNTGLGAVYRLDRQVLVDAELFRRLRVRGLARGGAEGIADLWAALELVTGPPLSGGRPGGYGWLAAAALDHVYTAAVVDLAHTVATHHLGAGEPERAATAARVALRAGSGEDIPLLDLFAAAAAQGQHAQAEAWVKQILATHDVQDEEELPPRTYQVLRRRQWLPPAA